MSATPLGRRMFPRSAASATWAGFAAVGCWLVFVAYSVFIAARIYRPDSNIIFIWFNAYTFWMYMPVYALALGAALLRRWILAVALAAVCVFHIAWILPDYRPASAIPAEAREAPAFTLMTTNVFFGNDDYSGIATEILDEDPDVLFLQEFGPRLQVELEAAGVETRYPYRQTAYENQFFGNAVYSKLPLLDVGVLQAGNRPLIRATVQIGDTRVRLYNIHPTSPGFRENIASDWNAGWQDITDILEPEEGALVIAGDFNINQHHRWYRELKDMGFKSAHEQRGRGNATTWPSGGKLRPIRIDHIFHSRDVITLSVREGDGEGSDHRPVIARLAVPGE